jgi:integrase
MLDEYAAHLADDRANRPNTIRMIRQLLGAVDREVGLDGLTPSQLAAYSVERGHKKSTEHNVARVVARFEKWALAERLVDVDRFSGKRLPKQPGSVPKPLSPALVHRLAGPGSPVREPLRSWFALAAYGGLRAVEISRFKPEHVVDSPSGPLLLVPEGKGGRAAAIPAHPEVVAVARSGVTWSTAPSVLSKLAIRELRKHGVDAGGIHRLRHTFATELYGKTGGDLLAVQALMRHVDVKSTMGYVAISDDGLRNAIGMLDVDRTLRAVPASGPVALDEGRSEVVGL